MCCTHQGCWETGFDGAPLCGNWISLLPPCTWEHTMHMKQTLCAVKMGICCRTFALCSVASCMRLALPRTYAPIRCARVCTHDGLFVLAPCPWQVALTSTCETPSTMISVGTCICRCSVISLTSVNLHQESTSQSEMRRGGVAR